MGKIEFSNCQDVRNQKKIQELDCPRCHEPRGIEAFVKDGILAEDGVCDNCGYILHLADRAHQHGLSQSRHTF